MRISKNKKNPYENLTRSQIKNKKLVDILNHKIFKGFRQIKNSKHFFIEKPNFVKAFIWDENKLEPFDDNYNLQYKKYYQQKNNLFFNAISNSFRNNNNNNKTFNNNSIKNNINFRNKKNKFFLTFTKNNINNNNNNTIEKNQTERMNILYKEIFPNQNELNIYNNFPLIFVEKKRKIRPSTANKKIITFNKNENNDEEFLGLTEKQFLYKISHNIQNIRNKQNNLVRLNNFNKNKGVYKGLTCSRPFSSQFSNYLEKKNKEKIVYKNAYTDQQEMEEYFQSLNKQEEEQK